MGSGDPPSTEQPTSPEVFASALADLKQTGAAVLVVGDVPQCVSRTVRRRLFGDATAEQRHRICVSTDAESPPSFSLSQAHEIDPARWTCINYVTPMRSVAQTASSTSNPTGGSAITKECTTLPALGIAISDSIAEAEPQHDGFSPAQLRVGFDSLSPIVENGDSTAFRFLHLLVERVKSVDGMIHCPLHYPIDSERVRLYTPLFDAVIELRVSDGEAQQRWHFTACDIRSAWLSTPP